jgi:hypothetical protein
MSRLVGRNWRLCIAGLAAWSWLAGLLAAARAQEEPPIGQGTHLFRHILDEKGLKPEQDLGNDPEREVLIVFGDISVLDPQVSDFVHKGGAALLATDRSGGGAGTIFGAVFHGRLVRVPEDSEASYKKTGDCIFVQPTGHGPPLFENLTMKGKLSRVATNRPGYLTLTPDLPEMKLEVVAQFPDDALLEREPLFLGPRYRPAPGLAFGAAGEWGQGRILLLADHSLFINAMLAQTDNENYEFAQNCIVWLGDKGRRDRVIFLDEGVLQEDFSLPALPPPPIESFSMDRLIRTADEAVVGMEEEGTINDLIFSALGRSAWPAGRDRETAVGTVLVVLTLALAGYGLARLIQARHRFEAGAPLLADAVGQLVPETRLPEQRQRTLLQHGNYWETARSLARELFASIAAPQQRVGWGDARSPLVLAPGTGGWWQRRRLQAAVNRLWRLAASSDSTSFSLGRLGRLRQDIASVHQAWADGRLARRATEENG